MKSDFAAARVHLDRAYHYLRGEDRLSLDARVALVELLETIATAECRQNGGIPETSRLPVPKRVRSVC